MRKLALSLSLSVSRLLDFFPFLSLSHSDDFYVKGKNMTFLSYRYKNIMRKLSVA